MNRVHNDKLFFISVGANGENLVTSQNEEFIVQTDQVRAVFFTLKKEDFTLLPKEKKVSFMNAIANFSQIANSEKPIEGVQEY